MIRHRPLYLVVLALLAVLPAAGLMADGEVPAALRQVPRFEVPLVSLADAVRADVQRAARRQAAHYAVPVPVQVNPWAYTEGWDNVDSETARWRLRVHSAAALSLNLTFSRFRMPEGGRLTVRSLDRKYVAGPFTDKDNESHGQLWTPPLPVDELLLELLLPMDAVRDLELELSSVQHGYAGFGEPGPKSGPCQVDVACPEAYGWETEARAVGLVSVAGVRFCTGFLLNNTAEDGTPYFLTAHHCGVTAENAPSVVVYWNHRSDSCRDPETAEDTVIAPGQFQTGAILRASIPHTDTSLLELDDLPDPAHQVYFAGWDRSESEPLRAVSIHHPNTDAQRVCMDSGPIRSTDYLGDETRSGGSHLRVGGWEGGTTEGGSSGAPLFNQERRVVGQLHGGWAACGKQEPDWFGRLALAWSGEGKSGARLSDWLDPLGSGNVVLDGLDASSLPPRAPELP